MAFSPEAARVLNPESGIRTGNTAKVTHQPSAQNTELRLIAPV